MQSLFPGGQAQGQRPNALDEAGRAQARELARAQREVARQLDEVSDADPTGRAQEMAREARMLAQALDQGAVDPATQDGQLLVLPRKRHRIGISTFQLFRYGFRVLQYL